MRPRDWNYSRRTTAERPAKGKEHGKKLFFFIKEIHPFHFKRFYRILLKRNADVPFGGCFRWGESLRSQTLIPNNHAQAWTSAVKCPGAALCAALCAAYAIRRIVIPVFHSAARGKKKTLSINSRPILKAVSYQTLRADEFVIKQVRRLVLS